MPKQSIPATAEGLPSAYLSTAEITRFYDDICGLSSMTKALADMLDQLHPGQSGQYEVGQASFAWNDVVSRAARLEVDFSKAIHQKATANSDAPKRPVQCDLIDGMDMLTRARDYFELLLMASERITEDRERSAFTTVLDQGIICLSDGISYVCEARYKA
ncbi:hypothetical protein [Phyllobacterium sp. 22552]|uniref:hypothetical protein n=1 Tax=Phyllobacterium sp. 22552 TaxID=3453941 RepID=UPI003F8763D1